MIRDRIFIGGFTMKIVDRIALLLVIVGALNWGG
ncbi:MAG: DUF378 domain-containing protein, partial [Oscillospiraceae bacterium]|nr:DUF378 domain-containing protein [Oscillospiraceae bacterium]